MRISDWSSDVCSSDLQRTAIRQELTGRVYLRLHFYRRMAFYHIDKIFNITGNVKTQKIALKQASNNFTSPGNDVENIGGGKRCMVKESDLYIRPERPQETRYHP